ncbi:MAG: ferredoxin domain-containing protein [Nitrospirota bacterium]
MKEIASMVAGLMAASARTAPKAGGKDFLEIVVITKDEDLKKIAEAMKEYALKSTNETFWLRDASNIENSQALLLIGLGKPVTAGYDCGGCGYPTCAEFAKSRQMQEKEMGYTGPHCVMRMMDIGVALSSAAKTASLHNVDNRVQQRVGAAARALGYIKAEVAMGIPVSITGKSIFFDRQAPAKH